MLASIQKFGGLDILISNAGAAHAGPMLSISEDDLRDAFELNFFSHYSFSKAAAKVFRNQNRG